MLLVLVVVWGVVLFSWFRGRLRTAFGDPVGTFQRRLTVLERTGPTALRSGGRSAVTPGAGRPVASSRSIPALRSLEASYSAAYPAAAYSPNPARRASGRPPMSAAAIESRRRTMHRRRETLQWLLTGALATFMLALPWPGFWALQIIFDILVGGYVWFLLRLKSLAVERDRKLAYLPRSAPGELAQAAQVHNATRATPARAAQRRWAAGDLDRHGHGAHFGAQGGMALRPAFAN